MAVSVNGQPLEFVATLDIGDLTRQVDAINKKLSEIGAGNVKGLGTEVRQVNAEFAQTESIVQKAALALGAYFSLQSATNFIRDIVRVRGEFQQLEVAFKNFLGNKEQADKLMAEAVQLAAQTPFTLAEVGTGARQLLAYGFAADTVTKNLTTLGNIAAGVGAPLGDIVYLYGTLKTQGRAYTRDILQFTSRGIPIISELAKQFGVTEENVQKLVEGGKVGFPEVERAFNSLTGTGGIFFNLMQEQSKTLTGLTSNLQDAWSRMLNEIGKSNEGVFTSAIQGATHLIDNYKEVLKTLEVIAVAYGTYRAAIIATNAAMFIQSGLMNGLSAGQALYQATVIISDRVTKAFNATLLSNPAAAAVAGLLAIVSALYIFHNAALKAVSASELLAKAEQTNTAGFEEKKRSIDVYAEALRKSNITEAEKLAIYEKIKAIDPVLVQGLNAQTISYGALTKNVDKYLESLRTRMALEANSAGVADSIKREQALQAEIDKTNDIITTQLRLLKNDPGNLALRATLEANIENLKDYNKELEKQKKTTKELVEKGLPNSNKPVDPKSTLTYRQQIAEAKSIEVIDALKANIHADYLKTVDELDRKQLERDEEYADARRKQLDVYGAHHKQLQNAAKEESGINSLLEKRKNVLDEINNLQRGAKQSGLIKEQSEIDKVNQKYDEAIDKIGEFNKKAEEFNKKNPSAKVSVIGLSDIEQLNKARLQETTNVTFKIDAENYRKQLERQKDVFEQFEDAKKELGIQKANEMYAEQTQGFESYIKFLQAEAAKIIPKVFAGTATIGDTEKLASISKILSDANDKQRERNFEKQKADYIDLLDASKTFTTQRADIEKKYNILYATLSKNRKDFTEAEYADRLKGLAAAKKEELDIVTKNELEKSDAYKKFEKGFDQIGITATKGILKGLKELRAQFKAMGLDVAELDKDIDIASLALNQKSVSGIRNAANLLRTSFKDMNIQVAGQLKITANQISDALENVSTLLDKTKGKTTEKVGSIIGLISFIIVGVRDALLTAKDLADPLQAQKDYYTQISGEIAAANELLLRQKKILDDISGAQKIQFSTQFLDTLNKKQVQALQSLKDFQLSVINSSREFFVDPVFHTKVSTGGINSLASVFLWGGQEKRNVELNLKVVDTSGFTTIEQFADLLQKIKEGGGKIDGKVVVEEDIKSLQALVDNYDKLVEQQKEFKLQFQQLLTGATSASITDSIVDGFRNGLRSANDFANTFQDLMKNAILQSLKIQALEGPLKAFFDEFADFSATDEVLTEDEIRKLRANFTGIIDDAGKKFDQLQKITNVDFSTSGSQTNSISGAIKGITEQQADLLAGQFGGLRLTAGEQLNVASQQLNVMNAIQANTAWIYTQYQLWQRIELNGIKIKP